MKYTSTTKRNIYTIYIKIYILYTHYISYYIYTIYHTIYIYIYYIHSKQQSSGMRIVRLSKQTNKVDIWYNSTKETKTV